MPSNVNESVPEDEVPMMAIFDGADGRPLESIAQIATRSVTLAGSDPPVADCDIRHGMSLELTCDLAGNGLFGDPVTLQWLMTWHLGEHRRARVISHQERDPCAQSAKRKHKS